MEMYSTFPLEQGNYYTVKELLEAMIIYSDNLSTELIDRYILENMLEDKESETYLFYTQLKKYEKSLTSTADFMSLFKELDKLDPPMQAYAFKLLSQVKFADWLVAQLPDTIVVSHKFGEKTGKGVFLLHDCGQVGLPSMKQGSQDQAYTRFYYKICVMAQWESRENLENIIAYISRFIFDFLTKTK